MNLKDSRAIAQSGKTDNQEACNDSYLTCSCCSRRCLVAALTAYAQATTGTIWGRVHSSDGLPLPGVMVAVTSPMLQGTRTAVTSESGDYLLALLPPGTYAVVFELDGFQSVNRMQQVAGAYNARVDVEISPAGMREDVTVVGRRAAIGRDGASRDELQAEPDVECCRPTAPSMPCC